MEHVLTHRMTGKAVERETVEVGLYRIVCSCGWEAVDVRGYAAMADAEERHRTEAERG